MVHEKVFMALQFADMNEAAFLTMAIGIGFLAEIKGDMYAISTNLGCILANFPVKVIKSEVFITSGISYYEAYN
jgi:hypothetical protein